MHRSQALLLFVLLENAACTVGSAQPMVPGSPAAPGDVSLHAASQPPRAFVVVGLVSAHSRDQAELVGELRKQAAALGADAVIGLRVTSDWGQGWLRASAVAVKWS